MTQKDKELLLKDICSRLPYGTKVKCLLDDEPYTLLSINWNKEIVVIGYMMDDTYVTSKQRLVNIKPYLRPMSSMTEEEKVKLSLSQIHAFTHFNEIAKMDWLNEHHFDHRGLIYRGLAIEVTDDNNPYKGD